MEEVKKFGIVITMLSLLGIAFCLLFGFFESPIFFKYIWVLALLAISGYFLRKKVFAIVFSIVALILSIAFLSVECFFGGIFAILLTREILMA